MVWGKVDVVGGLSRLTSIPACFSESVRSWLPKKGHCLSIRITPTRCTEALRGILHLGAGGCADVDNTWIGYITP